MTDLSKKNGVGKHITCGRPYQAKGGHGEHFDLGMPTVFFCFWKGKGEETLQGSISWTLAFGTELFPFLVFSFFLGRILFQGMVYGWFGVCCEIYIGK